MSCHQDTCNKLSALFLFLLMSTIAVSCGQEPEKVTDGFVTPLRSVVDLNTGDSVAVKLSDGTLASLRLLSTDFGTDPFRNAVRSATATVSINGRRVVLESANYSLPVSVGGVRLDCPVTSAMYHNTNDDRWGLEADARIRLWPADGPLTRPGSFGYPVEQRLLANDTQMSNEPCYANGCEIPTDEDIYYHSGLDFGGTEGMVSVLAATDGLIVSVGDSVLDAHKTDTPVAPRYDVVYVFDSRGWYFRYSHLNAIDQALVPGDSIRLGQSVGLLGKEGGSGGWSHLHFEARARQPSGKWGTEESYAYVTEAYRNKYDPALVAVARPHLVASPGKNVRLDGSRSWSGQGELKYEWLFTDGTTTEGETITRQYGNPGTYYEGLKVTDSSGRVDYDFCVVQILDRGRPELVVPMLHVNFHPSLSIQPGDVITFKARSFNALPGEESWDFGDGAVGAVTHSVPCWGSESIVPEGAKNDMLTSEGYDSVTHSYDQPGHYLVTVTRNTEQGLPVIARVHVAVGEGN
jgi:hypothetical protein